MAVEALVAKDVTRRELNPIAEEALVTYLPLNVTKHLDITSGTFYYVDGVTGESSWDRPANVDTPLVLTLPSSEEQLEEVRRKEAKENLKKERRKLITKRQDEYRRTVLEVKQKDEDAIREIRENHWCEADAAAARNFGEYSLSWKGLGYVSPSLYTFEERHNGLKLVSLKLVGHKLETVPSELFVNLKALEELSLANNLLKELPDTICGLNELIELNLVRNRLRKLPKKFGSLLQLRVLHISGNRLASIPQSFGNLLKLHHVILECNRISSLPETLGRLKCAHFNVNANRLATLPRCLKDMPNLLVLSACNNGLRSLPGDLGDSKSLTRLHLSSNRLTEIPEGLCRLKTLERLWLEHNFISGLPMAFHRLEALTDLRLHGNTTMVYPPESVIISGIQHIREWCKKRVSDRAHSRRQTLVMSLQDVLSQVEKFGIAHPSVFEPNVFLENKSEDRFFAVVWDEFWKTILPALEKLWGENAAGMRGHVTSFGYSRDEVDEVIEEYRDPSGRIMRTASVYFRRCSCRDEAGYRRVCVPPKVGWMCERKATLIKSSIVLERELQERMRQKFEAEDIQFREELGRKLVRQHAVSQEGKDEYRSRAIRRAEKLSKQRAEGAFRDQADALLAERAKNINEKFDKLIEKARKEKRHRLDHMKAKVQELEKSAMEYQGWARDEVEKKIDQLLRDMEKVPEDDTIATIEERRAKELVDAEVQVRRKKRTSFFKSFRLRKLREEEREFLELVDELMADMIDRDAEKAAKQARETALEEHVVLRRVMALWLGVGMRETFAEWKLWTKQRIKQRRRDAKSAVRKAWHDYEALNVATVMAQWRCGQFQEHWDDFQDVSYWVHKETGEVRYNRPIVSEFLPPGYSPPVPPATKLEDFSESDSESSASSSSSESCQSNSVYDSARDSEENHDEKFLRITEGNSDGESAGETDDQLLPSSRSSSSSRTSTYGGDRNEEEKDSASEDRGSSSFELIERESLVAAPALHRKSTLLEEGEERTEAIVPIGDSNSEDSSESDGGVVIDLDTAAKELQRSRIRAQQLRRKALVQFEEEREMRWKLKRIQEDGIEVRKVPTLEEAMALTGFDPDVDYTQAELGAFSKKAMKIMRDAGASLEGLDRYGFSVSSGRSSKSKSAM